MGWLKATDTDGETPVFLDASYASSEGDGGDRCMLYACGDGNRRRNLAAKPFAASPNLFLAGSGDAVARRLPASSTAAPTASASSSTRRARVLRWRRSARRATAPTEGACARSRPKRHARAF